MNKKAEEEDKFCELMEVTEKYLSIREKASNLLKKSFFELAQAKYSMGPTVLGPCSYSANMTAVQKLVLDPDRQTPKSWSLITDSIPGEQGDTTSGATDPLRWFGVIVPQYLREAQNSFKSVIPLLVELANHAQHMNLLTSEGRAEKVEAGEDQMLAGALSKEHMSHTFKED